MKLYTTILPESKELPKDFIEYFILPDIIPEEEAKEILGSIRSKSWGYWERLPRVVTEVKTLTEEDLAKLKDKYWKHKYVSTKNDLDVEQIFMFSQFVDHDCMYEAIQNFEEVEDAGFRRKLGAGFTDFKTCFGRSETLNLDSREELDTALLVY